MDGNPGLAQSPASGTCLQPPATAPHPASTLTALRGSPPRPAKFAGKSCRQLSPLCARVAGSDLLSLSPEQVQAWLQTRLSRAGVNRDDPLSGASSPMPLPLLLDAASCRKRLNDYTEGLLVQTAQKLDHFKAAFHAARGGAPP